MYIDISTTWFKKKKIARALFTCGSRETALHTLHSSTNGEMAKTILALHSSDEFLGL